MFYMDFIEAFTKGLFSTSNKGLLQDPGAARIVDWEFRLVIGASHFHIAEGFKSRYNVV